jgi:Outer membrane protein beta-barrel domain
LRKFATATSAFTVLLFATLAHAQQQIDLAVGGGTVFSPRNSSASVANLPPPERGGVYPSVSANVRLKDHLGLNVEAAWRDKKANYYGYESYRPLLMDVNGLFQQRLTKRVGVDLLGGVGLASNRFYLPDSCYAPAGTCYTSGTHFMEHLGIGVRYYFWRRFFVRPEAHYYRIQDNEGFHSDNLLRVGASLGYTFHQ